MSTSLADICTAMYYGNVTAENPDGIRYQYATFSRQQSLAQFSNQSGSLKRFLKPTGDLLWSSKLVDAYSMDDEDDEEVLKTPDGLTKKVPEWYQWVTCNEFHVPEYGSKNLIFIDVKYTKIVSQHHSGFVNRGSFTSGFLTDWAKVGCEFDGLLVDTMQPDGARFGNYDVNTLVIWNPACVISSSCFQHDGKSLWTYTSSPS